MSDEERNTLVRDAALRKTRDAVSPKQFELFHACAIEEWPVAKVVLVCFIALAMWRSFETWVQGAGMGHCGRQVLKELETSRSMDVVLPVRNKADIRLHLVSKPKKLAADLLARLPLEFPNRPKIVQNVVEKNGI